MKKRRRIPLDPARARALLRYDRATGALYWKAGPRKGKRADTGGGWKYRRVPIDGERYQAHMVCWLIVKGELPLRGEVDHEDGDGQNNRWGNLRDANRVQQMHNRGAQKNNSTGYKWVRNSHPGKYQAVVQLTLGEFKTPLRAHLAAREFVRNHHGRFFNPGGRGRAPGQGV